jgi:hypothetical protein
MTLKAVSIGHRELPTTEVGISTNGGYLNGAHAYTGKVPALVSGLQLNYKSSLLILECLYLANGNEAEAL